MALEQIKRDNPEDFGVDFFRQRGGQGHGSRPEFGCRWFVYKGTTRDNLLGYIRVPPCTRAHGRPADSPGREPRATEALAKNDRNPLSPREVEVLRKIMTGLSNDAIAEELKIDIETVKQHVKHILRKLHVEDRTQAALLALRTNLLEEEPIGGPT